MKKSLIGKILIAFVLCLCFMTEQVYATDLIKYKETKFSPPVKGVTFGDYLDLAIDSTGNVRFLIDRYDLKKDYSSMGYRATYVTYDSEGNKTVENLPNSITDRGFFKKDDNIYKIDIRYKEKDRLYVYNSEGKVVKEWTGDIDKKLGIKKDNILLYEDRIVDVTGTNKVMLLYSVWSDDKKVNSYAVQINIETGKMKKLFSFKFPVSVYDGEYVYGYRTNKKGTITFYRKSVKTKKTEKFTAKALKSVKIGKVYSHPEYTFCNGKVMGIAPKGGVYYGTFSKGKFKKIGSISSCKNFKKYDIQSFAMKSKNEFYLAYTTSWKKGKYYYDYYEMNDPYVVKYSVK